MTALAAIGVRGFLLLSLLPAVARARDLPALLTVESEPGAELCPSQPELAARVEAILRRPVGADTRASALAIAVRFERASDGAFIAQVTTRGPKPGQRWLRDTDPTCGALGEAVSVALALLLDSALSEGEDTSATAEPQPAPAASPPTSTAAVAPTADSAALPWHARVLLEAGGSYGLGAGGSLLGFGRLGVRHGAWLFDAGAGSPLPTQQDFSGGSVKTSLVFASLRACYLLGRSWVVGPCLQLGVGRLHGEGRGYGRVASSSLPWTAGGASLTAEKSLGAVWFATLGATLWIPTRRQTFSVQNAGIAWESRPVAGAATAGLGLTLF
ncbi:MAG TPA: hypothetical protein VEQ59_20760 [Polyangiaceae bacterium]|nr:hypothetical protein [Polyangiaceae bacterium]